MCDTFEIRCDVCDKVLESPYTLEDTKGWFAGDGATLCPEHNVRASDETEESK